jgi:hypothetical protein
MNRRTERVSQKPLGEKSIGARYDTGDGQQCAVVRREHKDLRRRVERLELEREHERITQAHAIVDDDDVRMEARRFAERADRIASSAHGNTPWIGSQEVEQSTAGRWMVVDQEHAHARALTRGAAVGGARSWRGRPLPVAERQADGVVRRRKHLGFS